ncbi:hypothetical protein [Actinocatenispora comari]|jgi:hypothetical protein|uniref:Uncharacterized protein n=1 Tax=Actinocatenispora comari TaxID=2807577 RepID=A0A8J4EL98_9ACTN|nr:hypothetical protein [Actinocatenispora comari]GIL27623.1 hypothetical protein NUM_28770 [Actinocatenispora comari]
MRRTLVLLLGLVSLAAGCGGPGITGATLAGSLGPTFRNMYRLQQRLLGDTDQSTADNAWARCFRGGAVKPGVTAVPGSTHNSGSGAGPGWTCLVHWPAPDGHTQTLGYEVSVQPDGCYTAQGPSGYVGQQNIRTPDGTTVPNPLYEFDGCFTT